MTSDEFRGEGEDEGPRRVTAPAGFVPVVDELGTLLFFYDPERDLVQIRARGRTTLVDLRMHQRAKVAQGKAL